jgi:tetratricopeptide (TPR) repeat protein
VSQNSGEAYYPRPWDAGNPVILAILDNGMAEFDTFAVQSIPPLPPLYYYTRYDAWKYLDVQSALSSGDYATAASYYILHIQENPDSYILWNNLGCCQMKLGEYDDALQSFDQSLAINPQFAEARSNRAASVRILAQYNRSDAAGNTVISGKTSPG